MSSTKDSRVTLLVKANDKGPDPLAAATLVDAVNRAYGMNIDTDSLRKEKKRIGADFKELSDKYTEHKKIDSNMYMLYVKKIFCKSRG